MDSALFVKHERWQVTSLAEAFIKIGSCTNHAADAQNTLEARLASEEAAKYTIENLQNCQFERQATRLPE